MSDSSDPFNLIKESANGWVADHRKRYAAAPLDGHLWDSKAFGGPGLLTTLILTTVGRRSGKISEMPLIYGNVESGFAIVASKGGNTKHPGWYHNLMNQDSVKVQVADSVFQASTRVAQGKERALIWAQMVEMYPPYNDYQISAGDRIIPIVVLERL